MTTTTPPAPSARTPLGLTAVLSRPVVGIGWMVVLASLAGLMGRWHWFLDLFSHFRWQYLAAGGLALVTALLTRRWAGSIVFGLVLLGNLALLAAPMLRSGTTTVSTGTRLRVLIANIHTANPAPERLLAWIAQEDPDIVGVLELSPHAAEMFRSLDTAYPTRTALPGTANFGIGLWSRLPESRIVERTHGDTPSVTLELRFDEARSPARLWLSHPFPPVGATGTAWRNAVLEDLATLVRQSAQPAILAGDLNATPWSAAFAQLESASGLRHADTGFGPRPTWGPPGWLRPILSLPLDHVMVSHHWQATRYVVGPDIGSDHRPVVVDLRR
ncbi:endonuclease/exonuclease/phosphatase family protein [Tahibacter amnicola]|uniref:Endonuclease/exonuclease/phosphatase family protein n=1 Tax=Tahibacter amnicola TaxID=2976241 RepID=A0ABY6BIN3_9GAMM|nr:endonuclease/exonuclease/phosphatase family protein [Tahibacter amnicola]UXI69451.1 endonuclease/exonuclease/phosphatase family protein [Tahibacter amnicola]